MSGPGRPPRVCLWGTFERDYPRIRVASEALRASGAELLVCHEPVWERTADKTAGYGSATGKLALAGALARAYPRLWRRYRSLPPHDALWVGYPGQADVPLAALLARAAGRALVFDPLVSLYDTAVGDRALLAPRGATARVLAALDAAAFRLADRVVVDTEPHADFLARSFGVPRKKLAVLPVGADDAVFRPSPGAERGEGPFTALHYGKFTPLHGVEHILEAAALLEARGVPVRFRLVGAGQTLPAMRELARRRGLASVRFEAPVPESALPRLLAESDVCLGIFGRSAKARRVVPNKVYQGLAAGRPVLTGASPAVASLLEPGRDCRVCAPGSGRALADALEALRARPEEGAAVARRGRATFLERFRPRALAPAARGIVEEALRARAGRSGRQPPSRRRQSSSASASGSRARP